MSDNPLSDISVAEPVYSADNNGKFALLTLLGSATLNPGNTVNLNAPFGTLTGTHSITQVYTITFGRSGGIVNATILEKANPAVPEQCRSRCSVPGTPASASSACAARPERGRGLRITEHRQLEGCRWLKSGTADNVSASHSPQHRHHGE